MNNLRYFNNTVPSLSSHVVLILHYYIIMYATITRNPCRDLIQQIHSATAFPFPFRRSNNSFLPFAHTFIHQPLILLVTTGLNLGVDKFEDIPLACVCTSIDPALLLFVNLKKVSPLILLFVPLVLVGDSAM